MGSGKKNILIFPAGTEIALEIFNALKYSKFVNVFGGTSLEDHSVYMYKRLVKGFPYYNEPGFIEYLNEVIKKYSIDFVYPANDAVQYFLMQHESEIITPVVSACYRTVKICRSKKCTYKFLTEKGAGEFIPKYFEKISDIDHYPVFVKPEVGQGSVGAELIKDKQQLEIRIMNDEKIIICEYLEGDEYTVDCFTDRNGKLRVVSMRNRARIRLGISVHSEILKLDKKVQKIAEAINNVLEFQGAWFFQLKKDWEGAYKLLEVSPRIPGTMGVSRNRGINFPLLTLYNLWGYDIDIIINTYDISVDRAFINRYNIQIEYDTVYVDFDDTLVIDNKVNVSLLAFLYQVVGQGKKVILITKHIENIYRSLDKYRISECLFSQIISIKKEDKKKKYISDEKAIFIDDSFAERKSIYNEINIPVFDLDMVESLIDWRR